MVTELTENLKDLLFSDDTDKQDLGLRAMGYNETEEDFNKLKELLEPFSWSPRRISDYCAYRLLKRTKELSKNPYAVEEVYIIPRKIAPNVE